MFKVWCEELGQRELDGFGVPGTYEKVAVTFWTQNYERLVCDGANVVVTVKDVDSGKTSNYNVSCDLMPEYTVKKVKK